MTTNELHRVKKLAVECGMHHKVFATFSKELDKAFARKNIDERMTTFCNEVAVIAESKNIDVETARNFAEYWTEHNTGGSKMRFEKETTWNTSRRLNTWMRNKRTNFGRTNGQQQTTGSGLADLASIIAARHGSQ